MPSQYGLPSFTRMLEKIISPGVVSTFQINASSLGFTFCMMPKMPDSTFTARAAESMSRMYAMSSPSIDSPGSIAVEVFPHALGKAPAKYVLRIWTKNAHDQHVLG